MTSGRFPSDTARVNGGTEASASASASVRPFFILLDSARARNARRDVDEETHRESQKQTRRRASTARSTRGRGADDHGESASVND